MKEFGSANFHYEEIGGVVVIYDLNNGGRTITNDIESVLGEVSKRINLDNKTVIYRDSMNIFDGINHDEGKFESFFSIQETDLGKALKKVTINLAIH